jgi:hypothetical protein
MTSSCRHNIWTIFRTILGSKWTQSECKFVFKYKYECSGKPSLQILQVRFHAYENLFSDKQLLHSLNYNYVVSYASPEFGKIIQTKI